MTSRGRGGSISDWDPMKDDFNDTSFNPQYPDDNASEVQLDQTKLYISKLPAALSQEGLVDLFSKYGSVVRSHYSRDPQKRYAFITFETAGEARIAMMKLHKTEPFNMNICFAHKKTQAGQPSADRSHSNTDRQMNRQSTTDRQSHNVSIREDSTSMSSKGRKIRNDHVNGNDDGNETEESEMGHDPKLVYDLEKIKLKRLEIMDQQLELQQRILIQQQRMKVNASVSTKRRLLPDGRSIQVTQDNETSFTAGGGDSRDIPRLQREASRRCVSCGAAAELYCAGCRLTPYCGERCQTRDWDARHRSVCHNLARSSEEVEKPVTDAVPPVTEPAVSTLRKPHAPVMKSPRQPTSDSGSERGGKKFIPPAEKHAAYQQAQQRRRNQPNYRNDNRNEEIRNHSNRANTTEKQGGEKENVILNNNQVSSSRRHTPSSPLRQPTVEPTKPMQVEPIPQEPKSESIKPEVVKPNVSASRLATIEDVTPRKPLVPASFVVEKLSVGAEFLAEVVAMTTDCGSKQPGCVCLTLHEHYSQMYNQLCEDFKELCEMDTEVYTPRIGETFAYLEEDGFWYRVRCLARTRGALIDAGRVISLTLSACRKLPNAFANIPEFMAVMNTRDFDIGNNLTCKVISVSGCIMVSLEDGSGASVQVEATRWNPEIEYPAEPRPPLRQPNLKQPTPEPQTTKPVHVQPSKSIQSRLSREPVTDDVRNVEVTRKPLTPANYVVEKLAVGAEFLAEVVAMTSDCGSKQPGCVCLTLHEHYSQMYNQLCEEFKDLCEMDTEVYTPSIGETFAYLEEDGFWYRVRCLARTRGALIDAGRVVSLTPSACRKLPNAFANIPEFMAVMNTRDLTVGSNLNCKVISSTGTCIMISVEDGSGTTVEVEAARWSPQIEYPAESKPASISQPKSTPTSRPTPKPAPTSLPTPKPAPTSLPTPKPAPTSRPTPKPAPKAQEAKLIPEVPRPAVERNSVYVLLDVTSLRRACVRPCDPRSATVFDAVLNDTVLYGLKATPLKEPPQKGQIVVAKFNDGQHYRAFVKRVNVAMNKYLIEYIEYGNEEIAPLERLYPCPPKLQLDVKPPQASLVKLSDREPATLTSAALKYIDSLKENAVELILTIPGGDKVAPSGSLVMLLNAKNCDSVSKKIEDLCIPEWKKLAERGGDVLEMEPRFFSQLKYSSIPTSRAFTLRVTYCDMESLMGGTISGYEKGNKAAELVYGELASQIAEYCESSLCKEPYLPKLEEMCIAKTTRDKRWVRSVLYALPDGAGSSTGTVLHVDSGYTEPVPIAHLRRIPPALVDAYPALANHLEIKNFPLNATRQQLERAMRFMKVSAEGAGELRVASCRDLDDSGTMFEIEVPELIDILTQ